MTSDHLDPPPDTRIVSIRGVFAASLVFPGIVHLLLAVSRAPGWRTEAVAFAAIGLAQVIAGIAVIASESRKWLGAVVLVCAVPALGWLWTRTISYPFGPWTGQQLEVHGLELLVAAAELVAVLLAVVFISRRAALGPPGFRLSTVGPVLVVLAAVPGLVGIEAVDNYLLEPDGTTHTHNP